VQEALKVVHPYDWTFTTDYKGTLSAALTAAPTDARIDYESLKVCLGRLRAFQRKVP
jgi:hypothetical protein